jgi:heat-inducible transcriptional repressor
MAELSDMGYLEQPHTSAGRIPSEKGFRYYVENLMPHVQPSDSEAMRILSRLDFNEGDRVRVLHEACEALSSVTGKAAIATTPADDNATVKGIRLVPLETGVAMVVVMTSAGTYKNRLARVAADMDYTTAELFCNACTSSFVGRRVSEITTADVQSVAVSMGAETLVTAPLVVCMYDALRETTETDIITDGKENLMKNPVLRQHAAELSELLDDSALLSRVLKNRPKEGVAVRIGRENGVQCLEDASVITTVYNTANGESGIIGVIAPVKTDYSHLLPIVNFTGSAVTRILHENK